MTGIGPAGPGTVSAVGSTTGGAQASSGTLAQQAVGAGLCEGFPEGPLSELLRYPDERQRTRQETLDMSDEAADELGLDFSDKAALARSMAALVDATTTYAADVYRIAVALLANNDSDSPDVVHEAFGNTSWRERLDDATKPLLESGLSRQTAQEFIRAVETAARTIESDRKTLPNPSR